MSISDAASWTISCCDAIYHTGRNYYPTCRAISIPYNNVTSVVISTFEQLRDSKGGSDCTFYQALVKHGPDLSNFSYNFTAQALAANAPYLAASAVTTVATVAMTLLL